MSLRGRGWRARNAHVLAGSWLTLEECSCPCKAASGIRGMPMSPHASSVAIVGVSTSEGPDAITVKSAGELLGWIDGRLGVTVVLFIWWNGMYMELGGEFHDPMVSTTEVVCTQMHFKDNSDLS